jgi:hypothetical protein
LPHGKSSIIIAGFFLKRKIIYIADFGLDGNYFAWLWVFMESFSLADYPVSVTPDLYRSTAVKTLPG